MASEEQLQRIVERTVLVRNRFNALREAHETVPNSFDPLEAALNAQRLAIIAAVRTARAGSGEAAMTLEQRREWWEQQREAAQEEIDRREAAREERDRMPRLRLRALA